MKAIETLNRECFCFHLVHGRLGLIAINTNGDAEHASYVFLLDAIESAL